MTLAAYLFNAYVNYTRYGQNFKDEIVGNYMARLVKMMRVNKEKL